MTVSTYLKRIADNAILGSVEKVSIDRSVEALRLKLNGYFGSEVSEQFRFGSYDRNTILPRSMDEFSDVDYMVVFKDGIYQPQTYLDKLRRFVTEKYSKSEISQSHPVIQLELSHIRFELVPAIRTYFYGLQIPQRDGSAQSWISTDPKDANDSLTEKNVNNASLIKPLVRLVKYWNASQGYPFLSYELEKKIISHSFGVFYKPNDLKGYFFNFMEDVSGYWLPEWKQERIQRAKEVISEVKELERDGRWEAAEQKIKKIIPEAMVTRRSLLS